MKAPARAGAAKASSTTVVGILAAISVSHLLNDTIQSLIPSIYPILKSSFQLTFSQIGLIALTLRLTASLLQPAVGMYTDRRPTPYSLVAGMAFSDPAEHPPRLPQAAHHFDYLPNYPILRPYPRTPATRCAL